MRFPSTILAGLLCALPAKAWFPHGSGLSASTVSLLTNDGGWVGGPAAGFYGKYTSSTPSTSGWTGTWTNCGGGSATITSVNVDVYGTGTYLLMVSPPSAAGSCVLNVTAPGGLGSASSPAATFISGPGAETSFQIHNAPGWQASHSYTYVAQPPVRVNNGAGWTPGSPGQYNPGLALNNYELIAPTTGSCTSAASGGPAGTGSSITDGGCTWRYTSAVDYVTLTGFLNDAPPWVSGRAYAYANYVTTNVGGVLRAYSLDYANGVSPRLNDFTALCVSTVEPSGTGGTGGPTWERPQLSVGADGCQWSYMGDVIYSSQTDPVPHITYANPAQFGAWGPRLTHNYVGVLWNDVEYLAGFGGENNIIAAWDHYAGRVQEQAADNFFYQGCVTYCPVIKLTTASGESFAAQYTTSTAIAGYDQSKGVGLRITTAGAGFYTMSAALFAWDWGMWIDGIQFKSVHGPGLQGFNSQVIIRNLIDAGAQTDSGWNVALYIDVPSLIANNLVFTHGGIGIGVKYNFGDVLFNTVINAGSTTDATALVTGNNTFGSMKAYNNALFGFPHAFGVVDSPSQTILGGGNVTDAPVGDSGTAWWVAGSTPLGTVATLPGTTYGSTAAAAFVAPGTDYRPKSAGALINAGAAFGDFNFFPSVSVLGMDGCVSPCTFNMDTPDLIGTTRPISGQYDAGALQH